MPDHELHIGDIAVRRIVRDLLAVAELALRDHMPMHPEAEIEAILVAALAIVERSMPPDLQNQDRRVVQARELLRLLRQTR